MGVAFDSDLDNGNLSAFKVLILPGTACLTDRAAENLERWVAGGGLLVATGETSLMDEWGRARDNFALADLLAVSMEEIRADEDPNELVAAPLSEDLEVGVERFSIDGPFVRVRVAGDATRVLAHTVATRTHPESGEPVITLRLHGKGEAVYIAPELGTGYTRWPHMATRKILSRLVRRRPLPYEVDAPTVVISNAFIMENPKRLLVHLLNLPPASNRVVRPGWPGEELCSPGARGVLDEILPIFDIRVGVRLFPVRSARLPLSDEPLEIARDGDLARVTVGRLNDHEIVEFLLDG